MREEGEKRVECKKNKHKNKHFISFNSEINLLKEKKTRDKNKLTVKKIFVFHFWGTNCTYH